MKSVWVEREAKAAVDRYAKAGIGADLALRVYTTRLIGRDPKLVLHGGGNTSLKAPARDLTGGEVEALYVKASGADMGAIEPSGFPALRLAPLRELRALAKMSDDDMARVQRTFLIDPLAPAPSVDMLLHAFMPAKVIDHSHAAAVLSLIDQPDGEKLCAEVYDGRLGFVPYRMPGFGLARLAADVFDKNPMVEGLILDKHGLFTFGETAREAYERMIAMVTLAEQRLQKNRKAVFAPGPVPNQIAPPGEVAPILRGAVAQRDAFGEDAHRRQVLEFRTNDAIVNFVNGKDVARYARAGVLTPDHVIRMKPWPLIVPAPEASKLADFRTAAHKAAQNYVADYAAYFARNKARRENAAMLDPLPRVVLVPGLGLFGLGANIRDARIAADVAEAAIEGITDAEAIGRFVSISEADMFDCEYWPLELAKLGQRKRWPLAGQVAAITGAAGAIGSATARAFAGAGAAVALLDLDLPAAKAKAAEIGSGSIAIGCDVTDAGMVRAGFDQVIQAFGGVDIVVSNAGAAWQGKIGEVDEETLRKSFELNFFAHQKVAQAAVKIMLAQGTGGCLLFNVSKQAVNPGPDFGPYGLPKAATLFLVRQYALDYGADGIRANAVNADRIRSGLLSSDFVKERAQARGISEKEYMTGNLLGREVTADDVAQAFLAQALALKTTADVTTVDGGNIAAALR
jgi:rhamnose utilization protein RhaD (predicted bifunctional aldolase and dehydrogenase)/NAD(P)-dependent dehydrogenase (short-subunit alcohol dehydrogenase family)